MNNETDTSAINDLIETLKDGQLGFQAAAEDAERTELKQTFSQLSSQRGGFATQLQSFVASTGEKPEKSGSVAGAVHRGWINLKSKVAKREDLAILEECERGEDSAVSTFRNALEKENLGGARATVESQYAEIRRAHDTVRDLRNTFRKTAVA